MSVQLIMSSTRRSLLIQEKISPLKVVSSARTNLVQILKIYFLLDDSICLNEESHFVMILNAKPIFKLVGWQCPNCTLWNDETRPGCAACAADKPDVDGAAAAAVTADKPAATEQPAAQVKQ